AASEATQSPHASPRDNVAQQRQPEPARAREEAIAQAGEYEQKSQELLREARQRTRALVDWGIKNESEERQQLITDTVAPVLASHFSSTGIREQARGFAREIVDASRTDVHLAQAYGERAQAVFLHQALQQARPALADMRQPAREQLLVWTGSDADLRNLIVEDAAFRSVVEADVAFGGVLDTDADFRVLVVADSVLR